MTRTSGKDSEASPNHASSASSTSRRKAALSVQKLSMGLALTITCFPPLRMYSLGLSQLLRRVTGRSGAISLMSPSTPTVKPTPHSHTGS